MPLIYGTYSASLRQIAKLLDKYGGIPNKNVIQTHERLLEAANHIDEIEGRLRQPHIVSADQKHSLEELKKISTQMGNIVSEFGEYVQRTLAEEDAER